MTKLIEFYSDFTPPPGVLSSVKRGLKSLPKEMLGGLESIILRDLASLSRSERVQRVRTKSGDVTKRHLLGAYFPRSSRSGARIEIYVDNLTFGWPRWALRIRPIRDLIVCRTLYHEIGHHLQTLKRTPGDREVAAEGREDDLLRHYFRQRYSYLRLPLKMLLTPLRAVRGFLDWRK